MIRVIKNMVINQVVYHSDKYYLISDEPDGDDGDDVAWPEVTLHGQMLYNLLMKIIGLLGGG